MYSLPAIYIISPDGVIDRHGVIPDYEITVGIEDYDVERDPELEFILSELEELDVTKEGCLNDIRMSSSKF
ncbi:MAG TPA: hypothetical protein PK466_10970 [Thermotogota bacterium]|nr:hypothetical protein [Thermotogota bacterium]HPJ89648.1 hypothetical protein [Thermotogota bacterium]HPR96847.1 hypothetical protein [Thermotogota bacterium]